MHISKFVSLLLFVVSFNTICQHSKKIENYTFDELSDKYYEYKFTDSLKAKKFANFYFNKAVKDKDTVNAIDGKYYLSEVYKNDSIYIDYLDSIINISKSNPTKMFPAYVFLQKGNLFFHKGSNNESLKNYLSALMSVTLDKSDSLKFIIKQRIGTLKSNNNEIDDAKNLYLEAYGYFNKNYKGLSNDNYFSLLMNLSLTYSNLRKIDSSRFFINEAFELALKVDDKVVLGYCYAIKSNLYFKENKFNKAIETSLKSIPQLLNDENHLLLMKSYSEIAKSYNYLGDRSNSFKYHKKIDSIYLEKQIINKNLINSYRWLTNYYRTENDLDNQLKTLNKLLAVDSISNSRNKNLSKTFTQGYDRPKLITEKQKIISELNNEVSFYKKSRIYIALILILSFILFLYQFKKRKKQEQKFDNLTLKLKNKKVVENSVNSSTNVQKTLPENIITELLAKLDSFEQQPENFTNNKLTLSILAKELETNSNYLSKVINQKKGCNFSTYLRKLRINYALDLLETDATIRRFSIDAIAKEVGFKNAETFSKAFFKETELNPSFYIKQLEKKK